MHAVAEIDFRQNAMEMQGSIPLFSSDASLDVRWTGNFVYLHSGVSTSAKWLKFPATSPSLFGTSLEMIKPDLSLLTGFDAVTKQRVGNETVRTYIRHRAALSAGSGSASQLGSVRLVVTTGRQGEIVSVDSSTTQGQVTTDVSAVVSAYNTPVHVLAPPASQVRNVSPRRILKVIRHSPLARIVIPMNLGPVA